ncbi:IclR family transcriptional regulator [Kribbella sp. NPDC050124]|uniref:IclR family transcriptional regulator n=1 Tax=Kribbella sp. NPDC050124 TaxID=3364114 RepID=UPI0037A70E58
MRNSRAPRDNSVHSVDRAISILQVLARLGAAGVTEIAAELDVHKSTVSRLLSTLEARGLVEQSASRGRYRLGYGMVQIAAGATHQHDLSVISRPICRELAEVGGETVTVAVQDGHDVVSIDQVIGSSTVTTVNWVGQRTPMHATSAGKLFLANMTPAERTSILAGELERYTEHTIVDADILERDLEVVRQEGYAHTLNEHEVGLAAIAAPIRSLDGEVIAALCISGPSFRINEESRATIAKHVVAAAAEISTRVGYPKVG